MPPIVLRNAPVAYYGTPKVACTSIKMALYELEHGVTWVDFQDDTGKWHHIHNTEWYPKEPTIFAPLPDPDRWFKFAVIRDPIARALSAYGNRVVHHGELSASHLAENDTARELELPTSPDLATFIERLEDYCRVSVSIEYHMRPQCFFIGTDLSYFDSVYRMELLNLLPIELAERTGRLVHLPHFQFQGPKFSAEDLTAYQKKKLIWLYEEDYDLLSHEYPPPVVP